MTLAHFNAKIDAFGSKLVPEQYAKFRAKIALEALSRLVLKTPVDTGRARGNWQVTINEGTDAELASKDKAGGGTIAKGAARVLKSPTFSDVFITNNVPYIVRLEEGHSQQSSQMMATTINELTLMFS